MIDAFDKKKRFTRDAQKSKKDYSVNKIYLLHKYEQKVLISLKNNIYTLIDIELADNKAKKLGDDNTNKHTSLNINYSGR